MRIRHWARQLRYAAQISRNRFESPEPEFRALDQFLRPGDWAIDVGANVGHYTKRMSDIVGHTGRVIALVKIDAEGHEGRVLLGMRELLIRDKPTIIVEASAREAKALLNELGYHSRRLDGSPNLLLTA